MNVGQILAQLQRNEGHFAKDAILEAVVRREEMILALLNVLRDGLRRSFQLRDRARTCDQNIDESFCALLPVRAGCYVGDADKSPKEIHWVEVLAYIAALDRTLHQGTNRFMGLSVGSCEHFLGISDQSIQYRGDDLLRLDGINEQ
jgi:hypothetical protein